MSQRKKGVVSFEAISKYYDSHKNDLHNIGLKVEELIVDGRNNDAIPVYVTKMRVKALESIYLKTKRKPYDNVDEITDIVGLRALCLFEQDIAPTFEYLFRLFSGLPIANKICIGEFYVNEITLFNWGDEFEKSDFLERMCRVLASNGINYGFGEKVDLPRRREMEIYYPLRYGDAKTEHRTIRYRSLKKGTGYKSVHFVAKFHKFSFEVQSRTLLQDVWGELEHSLAYKQGSINPLIKNNFELFARELQVKDNLMSELRDIRDKDLTIGGVEKRASPSHWLGFDQTILKRIFVTSDLMDVYAQYEEIGRQYSKPTLSENFVARLRDALGVVKTALGENLTDAAVKHWVAMEEAFLLYCEGEYSEAKTIYEQQVACADEICNSMWAVHYRLGELCIHEGRIEKALVSFDRCEAELNVDPDGNDVSDRERYFVNSKLAYVYWELGFEYIDIAIDKITLAEVFFNKYCYGHSTDPSIPTHKALLLNNICYYFLEGWLSVKDEGEGGGRGGKKFKLRDQTNQYCAQLESHLNANKNIAASNMYDTLAWFHFNRHLEGRTERELPKVGIFQSYDDIKKARAYLQESLKELSYAISPIMSDMLRRRHAETILIEYGRLCDAGLISEEGAL